MKAYLIMPVKCVLLALVNMGDPDSRKSMSGFRLPIFNRAA